jgi:hypothetical protein
MLGAECPSTRSLSPKTYRQTPMERYADQITLALIQVGKIACGKSKILAENDVNVRKDYEKLENFQGCT